MQNNNVIDKYSYCTLFDSNYIDKGIVTIQSLVKQSRESKIYVLCMDFECFSFLKEYFQNLERIRLIKLDEFETSELLDAKANRSKGEYCWTCTASLLSYIFEKFHEEVCTYIDADLYFFSNPDLVVSEFLKTGKSVQIIEHGFKRGLFKNKQEQISGKYCVEFNTFVNNEFGRIVLEEWRVNTLRKCSAEARNLGDQGYLTEWPQKYQCIDICSNFGVGVAPWNINRFALADSNEMIIKEKKEIQKVVFYHFHDLVLSTDSSFNINVFKRYILVNEKLVNAIYGIYLNELLDVREMLSKCGKCPNLYKHPELKQRKTWIEKLKNYVSKPFIEKISLIYSFLVEEKGKNKDIYSFMCVRNNFLRRRNEYEDYAK